MESMAPIGIWRLAPALPESVFWAPSLESVFEAESEPEPLDVREAVLLAEGVPVGVPAGVFAPGEFLPAVGAAAPSTMEEELPEG